MRVTDLPTDALSHVLFRLPTVFQIGGAAGDGAPEPEPLTTRACNGRLYARGTAGESKLFGGVGWRGTA